MAIRPETRVRAERDKLDWLVTVLAPLEGAIWLVTDLPTQVHWTIAASSIEPVSDTPDGRFCRAFGLVTICDHVSEPVFLVNEGDSIHWVKPQQILTIREFGEESCEIRLERLQGLDAPLIDAATLGYRPDADHPLRTIAIGPCRYLQINEDQLPTGDDETDVLLRTIETTIDARRRLVGPAAGTLDVMEQMERELDVTLRSHPVHSYVWAAVLREQIAKMRQALAA